MGRGSDFLDELVEEAPQGAANALIILAHVIYWTLGVIIAGTIVLLAFLYLI